MSEFGINTNQFRDLDELKNILKKTNFGKEHNLQETQEELGAGFDLKPAEIYAAGAWGTYTEPAIVIEGSQGQLPKVYQLAEKFRQSRIAVEDLKKRQSYMVETKYCQDPDKE